MVQLDNANFLNRLKFFIMYIKLLNISILTEPSLYRYEKTFLKNNHIVVNIDVV